MLVKTETHFITSKRGNQLLVYRHYTFALSCKSKSKVSWTCSSRCSRKCRAHIAVLDTGELLVMNGEHTHPPPVFYKNSKGEYSRLSDRQLEQINCSLKTDLDCETYECLEVQEKLD